LLAKTNTLETYKKVTLPILDDKQDATENEPACTVKANTPMVNE